MNRVCFERHYLVTIGRIGACVLSCLCFAILLVVLSSRPIPVSAFASFKIPGNVHEDITTAALSDLQFAHCAIAAIVRGDNHQDWDEFISSEFNGTTTLFKQLPYDPRDHFDRPNKEDLNSVESRRSE